MCFAFLPQVSSYFVKITVGWVHDIRNYWFFQPLYILSLNSPSWGWVSGNSKGFAHIRPLCFHCLAWMWASSESWWWTGKPGVLQSMGLQRVRHDWVTELKHTFEHCHLSMTNTRGMNKCVLTGLLVCNIFQSRYKIGRYDDDERMTDTSFGYILCVRWRCLLLTTHTDTYLHTIS